MTKTTSQPERNDVMTHSPGSGFLTASEAAACREELGQIERPECGAVADLKRESKWITDPVCHLPAGHSGTHVCIEQRGERAGFIYTATPKVAEVARLDVEQRGYYGEATSCGASHNDAMEAALTYGYTR